MLNGLMSVRMAVSRRGATVNGPEQNQKTEARLDRHGILIARPNELRSNTRPIRKLKLAAIHDDHLLRRLAAARADLLDGLDNIHPLHNRTKDDVLPIQMGSGGGAQEELRPIRTGTSIGHRQDPLTCMLQIELLVVQGDVEITPRAFCSLAAQ